MAQKAGSVLATSLLPMPRSTRRLRSRRPVIIVGHGARFHMPSIVELAERLGSPVLTTFKGKGVISDHHSLGCGVLGRSGTPVAAEHPWAAVMPGITS